MGRVLPEGTSSSCSKKLLAAAQPAPPCHPASYRGHACPVPILVLQVSSVRWESRRTSHKQLKKPRQVKLFSLPTAVQAYILLVLS